MAPGSAREVKKANAGFLSWKAEAGGAMKLLPRSQLDCEQQASAALVPRGGGASAGRGKKARFRKSERKKEKKQTKNAHFF